jgi:hypothetical protein
MGAAIETFGLAAGFVSPLKNPDDASVDVIQLAPSLVYPAGTIVGEVTATPGVYAPYNTGNAPAGTANPTHILQYSVATDASGNIFMGGAALSEWSAPMAGAPAYRNGMFNCADLIAPDTGWVAKMGRLVQGTATAGHVMIYGV